MNPVFLESIAPTEHDRKIYCPIRRKYYLGDQFPEIYLTQREAECSYWVIRGLTNKQVADQMQLSPRTIEYYLRNIRCKLNCYSKIHLVKLLQKAAFLPVIEEQIKRKKKENPATLRF
jgi:DNA-binding CsgD family transcriptional regulator